MAERERVTEPEPVTIRDLSKALGMAVRTLERLATQGVIAPAEPRRGSRASRWDVAACARAIIAHRAQVTPRDRRELAQAELLELRHRRESREVLRRADVVRKGVAVAKTVTAYLVTIPSRMVKDGLIAAEHEAAVGLYIRERLDELSRLADEDYLTGDDDAEPRG